MTWRQHDINLQPHAVYRMYDAAGALLYVGVSANVETRVKTHKSSAPWAADYSRHELTWYQNRWEAESAEAAAIMDENPLHNVAGNPQRRPRQEKPIRFTLDLEPDQHRALREFVASAGAGGRASQVLRALLDELRDSPELASRIQARIWEGTR